VRAETGEAPLLCPVNEISFVAWSGGSTGHMNPFAVGKGNELKRQVVRAALAGTRAARAAAPGALVFAIEPRIHIVPRPEREDDIAEVERLNDGQWHAWDMLLGRREPELGGAEDMLDAVGVNLYWNNQWVHQGSYGVPLSPCDERWRPLRRLLADVHARYRRPLFVAETSCEGDRRAAWFRYVAEEVREALRTGLPVEGGASTPCSATSAGTTTATARTACSRWKRRTAGGRCTRRWRGSCAGSRRSSRPCRGAARRRSPDRPRA
jgi:hypothetical protein